jgi:hypothetical protein
MILGGSLNQSSDTLRRLSAELDRLEQEYAEADELPEEVDQRLSELETALEALDERPVVYDPTEIGRAAVFVSIDSDGDLRIERGYVRPEDEPPVEPVEGGDRDSPAANEPKETTTQHAVITIGAGRCSRPIRPENMVAKLKLTAFPDDRPVKLTIEVPAAVHRDLVAYAEVLAQQTSQKVEPAKLIAPMLARFKSVSLIGMAVLSD